jgi:hypothetical protein
LGIASVPEAQVWSLRINGKKKKIYSDQKGAWIIPLSGSGRSHVELAFLRQGEKLGLQGRLETSLPRTGLPSRRALVGIALPERVQLLSLEGPVSPDRRPTASLPKEFMGRSYFFSRAFYGGDGMEMAISYKEPVDMKGAGGSN